MLKYHRIAMGLVVVLALAVLFFLQWLEVPAANRGSSEGDVYLPLTANMLTPEAPTVEGMILIPAGEFQMGCDHNIPYERCFYEEVPLHTVFLDAYYIDVHEVTNAQYGECDEAGACDPPSDFSQGGLGSYYDNPDYADYPVVYVHWFQATDYCAWAGKRLPTEAEWDKSARGNSDTRMMPWGGRPADCTLANANWGSTFISAGNPCGERPDPVGSYPAGASPYGVMDMVGNVREWVNDWYDMEYYQHSPGANPTGPASGTLKVVRGNGFTGTYGWYGNRIAHRDNEVPEAMWPSPPVENRYTGFRCAADP